MTDWMWCYERPRDAACEIDRLTAELAEMTERNRINHDNAATVAQMLVQQGDSQASEVEQAKEDTARRCAEIAQEAIDALDDPDFEFNCDIYDPIQHAIRKEFGLNATGDENA